MTVDQLTEKVPFVAVTFAEKGSELRYEGKVISIPVAPVIALVDPTGGGDAYRAGLIKGLLLNAELPVVGRMAALAATYVIEQQGPQEHSYSAEEFTARFDREFPDYAGALTPDQLRSPASASAMTAVD